MPLQPVDNELELLEKVANGDENAFASLFYSYHNQLGEFILLLTRSTELTEEIIQDVFMKVWEMRATLTTVNHFTGWLFILARNYTLNSLRKQSAELKKSYEYGRHLLLTESETGAEGNTLKEYDELIKKAIAQLPDQQRKVFSLRHEEGLSYAAIAEVMNISKETVKKYLQLALKSVCKYIKSNFSSLSEAFLLLSFLGI